MRHRNDMTAWTHEIACQRGHDSHSSVRVDVSLDGPTAYFDYPPIPHYLARNLTMQVWDPAVYPVDGGPYCPAHDAVSETIVSHRVWEPRETCLTLDVCQSATHPVGGRALFMDFGSQLGWFSSLAASCGLNVHAWEADEDNARMTWDNAVANEEAPNQDVTVSMGVTARIGPDTPVQPPSPVRMVKADVEGAEADVVRILQPSLAAGLVDYLLLEISPIFHDGYPQLVVDLCELGYVAHCLPPKSQPPATFTHPLADIRAYRLDDPGGYVCSIQQEDLFFVAERLA